MKLENNRIIWKSTYNLGVEDIDFQHHFFANLINRIAEELQHSDYAEYKFKLISELNAYASFHFISEENMMFKANYPKLAEHKKHHLDWLERLSIAGNTFKMNPSKEEEEKKIMVFLMEWFLNHTMQEDKLFADYLHGESF